ncbi:MULTISPECIES: hypothetical protein [unclassified Streptomyces]|uniref:LppU/SCO3897 family protein n=1 Tax=unclassified Streptomyces TaxID=2593676 RepID=UPI001BE63EC9|nr:MULTISPECIES: hypothetical protein [unclassified Streptomyces]MBT2403276.1 hypothetical protein [Streptomyces sp. ISL-21]MBT2457444.1 hypothetical protein [Streptomyces sp. ISL-86]MBT2609768.1 hypothetical protein [Streptomyces sp. ISL-87]
MATPPPQHGAGPYPPYAAQQGGPYGPQPTPPQQGGPHWPHGPYAVPPQQQAVPYGLYPPPQGAYGCRVCGAQPAAHATVRGHQGMIVVMRFLSLPGPFCRDCGLSTYRRMSADTLWQGWWGPLSLFITPVTLLMNLGPRSAFRKLAPPAGGYRPALDPGKPMLRRAPVLLFLVPLLLFFLAIPTLIVIGLLVGEDKPALSVGECVRNKGTWSDQRLEVVDCYSSSAQYKVTKRLHSSEASCAPLDFVADPAYSYDGSTPSCLTPLH